MRGDHPFLLRLGLASIVVLAALTFAVGVNAADAATETAAVATADTPIDPNTLGRASGDAVSIVRWISPGIYELDVQNTSGIGYINVFTWTPPPAMTVTAVTKTVGGKCSLTGGYIQCSGKIPPPKCTCSGRRGPHRHLHREGPRADVRERVLDVLRDRRRGLQIRQMTPVPYHIPSALPQFSDVPVCKKGQTSTKAKPCV